MAGRGTCKYREVAGQLRRRIESGELSGTLPGVKQLALEYDVNFMTADKAIRQLESEDIVHRIPRKGTYVRQQKNIALCGSDPNPHFNELGFYGPLIGAIQSFFGQRNCFMIFENIHGRNDAYLEVLAGKIDGVIIMGKVDDPLPEPLRNLPHVRAMGVIDPKGIDDHVSYDSGMIGRIAGEYLYGLGRRRFAYIGYDHTALFALRRDVFRTFVEARGCSCATFASPPWFGREYLIRQLDALIAMPERPDGISCSTDVEAVFTMNYLLAHGIRAGRDYDIIGCNHEAQVLNVAAPVRPATIDLQLYDIGAVAAERLYERVNGADGERFVKVFEPQLVLA